MRLLIVAVLLLGSALPASAAPGAKGKTEAKEAFKRALQYYNLGEFSKALDGFKEAYLDYPDSSFLFNIGQCQRQLGMKQDAVLSYKAYLREDPSSPRRDEILAIVHNLESLIREDEAAKKGRPEGTIGPDSGNKPPDGTTTAGGTTTGGTQTTGAGASTTLTATTQAPPPRTPVYKRWWLWAAVGVVAVGVGVGLGVGLSAHGTSYPNAPPSDGTIHF